MLWFKRKEFIRYCWFHAYGSARDTFDWEQLKNVEIPIPPLNIQNDIALVDKVIEERKEYLESMKGMIKDICPILIIGSTDEAREE